MAIENRNLWAGAKLAATYKKEQHFCDVLKTDDGLAFQLKDGKVFKSPSSAGKAITGRVSCDGWKFWSMAGEGSAPASEATTAEPVEPKAKAPKTVASKMVRVIRKMPNQKGVEEGSTKWWCSACMKAFLTESAVLPEQCLEGHPWERADEFAAVPAESIATE